MQAAAEPAACSKHIERRHCLAELIGRSTCYWLMASLSWWWRNAVRLGKVLVTLLQQTHLKWQIFRSPHTYNTTYIWYQPATVDIPIVGPSPVCTSCSWYMHPVDMKVTNIHPIHLATYPTPIKLRIYTSRAKTSPNPRYVVASWHPCPQFIGHMHNSCSQLTSIKSKISQSKTHL